MTDSALHQDSGSPFLYTERGFRGEVLNIQMVSKSGDSKGINPLVREENALLVLMSQYLHKFIISLSESPYGTL
jgi:hypothetical protein